MKIKTISGKNTGKCGKTHLKKLKKNFIKS